MSGISGYQNQKKIGPSQFGTIENVGSDRYALPSIQMCLRELNMAQEVQSITISKDEKFINMGLIAHGARIGDILRTASGWDYNIHKIVNANTVQIYNIAGADTPVPTDFVDLLRWVPAKAGSDGGIVVSPGPLKFLQDGVETDVFEDTTTPSNTVGLPVVQRFSPVGYSILPLNGVNDANYTELVNSVGGDRVKKIQIFMDSGTPLLLCFGAAAAEIPKFLIIPGGTDIIDIDIPAGTRLSVILASAGAALTEGTLYLNLLG